MKISMKNYIDKCLKKFKLEHVANKASPATRGDLKEGKEVQYPLKSVLGAAQWVAVMARPDITFSVQRVQRCTKVTSSAVTAAKRIFAYLKGTADWGITYSPEAESDFNDTYVELRNCGNKVDKSVFTFSDADFAGCPITFRSTSGTIVFLYGCPIMWASKRQSFRALSTCESEHIAGFDSITVFESLGWLDFLLDGDDIPLNLMIDNMSAISVSHQEIATKKSKHFSLRCLKVKDYKNNIFYVPTELNKADALTKILGRVSYLNLLCEQDAEYVGYDHDDPVDENPKAYWFSVD